MNFARMEMLSKKFMIALKFGFSYVDFHSRDKYFSISTDMRSCPLGIMKLGQAQRNSNAKRKLLSKQPVRFLVCQPPLSVPTAFFLIQKMSFRYKYLAGGDLTIRQLDESALTMRIREITVPICIAAGRESTPFCAVKGGKDYHKRAASIPLRARFVLTQ
ncbi:hypothetical protein [Microvirgula sp. AG722]|uniref:hypothetical protein n=1 Tax=Microvirgula sp. AG722 TaxID=2183901 RepID=UPI0011BF75E9|nr:hypothetical protein [Microvirgula sp. AG722]